MVSALRSVMWCCLLLVSLLSIDVRPATAAQDASGVSSLRSTIALRSGWRFRFSDDASRVTNQDFDDTKWERVAIPHTWNRVGGKTRPADYNNFRGVGWYRLTFPTPAEAAGRRAWLQFDAVSQIADVWLNGVYLGRHEGGFSRFRLDATKVLMATGDNVLVVKADNSKPVLGSSTADILPIAGDFFIFGGIYRDVSLVLTDPIHIDMLDHGGPGVYVRTVSADHVAAEIEVATRLRNLSASSTRVRVTTTVNDAGGRILATDSHELGLSTHDISVATRKLRWPRPRLWNGVADPYLHRVIVKVHDSRGRLLDQVAQDFGVRTFRIDPNQGFILNGRRVPLQGVNRHQDREGKGWAISRDDMREDMEIIAEIGANTVRLAHYQHDDYAYDLADRMGMAVWAEIPLVSQTLLAGQTAPSPGLIANAKQQLVELIRQNYNRPSVITWAIANEVNLSASRGQVPSNAIGLLRELNALAKSTDPSRPSSLADCCLPALPGDKSRQNLEYVAGLTDAIGYNRYFGWYFGNPDDLVTDFTALHVRHPDLPISLSEYGAGGALTQHTDNPRGGPINSFGRPHPEAVQSWLHEEWWARIEAMPFIWGSWVWNMFDFASDERQEGDSVDLNDKGLVSFDRRTRKDAFYFYKASWSSAPVVHLTGRRYIDRAYPVTDVRAYSNARGPVRLTVNGQDLGAGSCARHICVWREVRLQLGHNELVATADFNGREVTDRIGWRYAGDASTFRIRTGNLTGVMDGGHVYGSDNFFTGGIGRALNPPRGRAAPDTKKVSGTDMPALYESYREGRFSYDLPVPNGEYRVRLRFFEPIAQAGQRRFDVLAEGRTLLPAFDVAAAANGVLRAVDRTFEIAVRDGRMTIDFVPKTGEAIVSAIEVERRP